MTNKTDNDRLIDDLEWLLDKTETSDFIKQKIVESITAIKSLNEKFEASQALVKLIQGDFNDAADALQAAQEENERLKSERDVWKSESRTANALLIEAKTKLAAIRDAVKTANAWNDSVFIKMRRVSWEKILNTTNVQPAQEQGGKE